MRHRPGWGWGWLVAALAVCALLAGVVLLMAAAFRPVGAAERLTLRPGEFPLLVRMAYSEARGDGLQGMVAVSHVALNRWEDGRFGKSLRAVLTAPNQFSVGPARDESDIVWLLAVYAASGAVLGKLPDLTGSAQYFVKADMAHPPKWTREFILVSRIGSHAFYRREVD